MVLKLEQTSEKMKRGKRTELKWSGLADGDIEVGIEVIVTPFA